MAKLKWLYPGLNVKRWIFLAFLGLFLIVAGAVLVVGPIKITLIGQDMIENITYLLGWHSFYSGIIIFLLGLLFMYLGVKKAFRSIVRELLPEDEERLAEVLYEKRQMKKGPKILAFGGGTGLPVVLRGVKIYTSNITAVVAVSDDGGSSGKLRGELDMLPPGDIRNCLLALADTEPLLERIFEHRFKKGKELSGHNVGNLIIAALNENMGFLDSIKTLSKILAVKGKVLPVTDKQLTLEALYKNGKKIKGESKIPQGGEKIENIKLKNDNIEALPEVKKAIREADAIILGPGSLYTSIIPNLLVPGVVEEIEKARVPKIWVANIMTQPGETDEYTVLDHLEAIKRHAGSYLVDTVMVNVPKNFSSDTLEKYRTEEQEPVELNYRSLKKLGFKVVQKDFAAKSELIRHDHEALGREIMKEIVREKLKKDFNFRLWLASLIRSGKERVY